MSDENIIKLSDIFSESEWAELKKNANKEVLSILISSLGKKYDELSETEKYVLEKTAISYCEGLLHTEINDLKDWLQFSNSKLLFAFEEIEVATKSLIKQLEAASKKDHLFTKALITFYSKEEIPIFKIEKSLQAFSAFFAEDARFLWQVKIPENNETAFVSIICE